MKKFPGKSDRQLCQAHGLGKRFSLASQPETYTGVFSETRTLERAESPNPIHEDTFLWQTCPNRLITKRIFQSDSTLPKVMHGSKRLSLVASLCECDRPVHVYAIIIFRGRFWATWSRQFRPPGMWLKPHPQRMDAYPLLLPGKLAASVCIICKCPRLVQKPFNIITRAQHMSISGKILCSTWWCAVHGMLILRSQ